MSNSASISRRTPVADYSATLQNIRRLIYLYLFLLIIEGALRKWIVPQFSNPLLLVRDPVVLAIYLLAWRAHIFPRNAFISSLATIGILSWIVSIFVLDPYVPMSRILLVTAYGFRSNFLHFPLIFIFASVFGADDVRKIGWWILLGMIPMSLLMALQFHSAPDSFINRTVGLGEGEQITAGGGKIRPPATFSFISGPIHYVTAAAAFVLYGGLRRASYGSWLLLGAGCSVLLAIVVSGSRSLVVSVLLVLISLAIVLLIRPDALNRFGKSLVLLVIALLIVTRLPIVHEGLSILSSRFTQSAEAAETTITGGLIQRTLSGFTEGLGHLGHAPIFGFGLGVGTSGGAAFLMGQSTFLLSENEWTRIIFESGPILGLAFLLWRAVLTAYLGFASLRALTRAEILPLLIFSAGFLIILNGQLGQPTSLGFAVVLNGLCLASTRPGKIAPVPVAPPLPRWIRGRSAYADRLHGADASHRNGSADR
ncbi:MAG: hypothetical protein DMC59_00865 [Verrucomicrobia bacterium]|nr:MAG: hypothetical protein DMC59_00865 [Verrucomicrobiota bacterium]